MGNESRVGHYAPGAYAVVIPVDRREEVRVIDWPVRDSLNTLYRALGCETVDLRVVGALGFWVDDEGAVGEEWEANGRAAWLGVVVEQGALLVAGAVVVTLAEPDSEGETRGLARELALRVAMIAGAVPDFDQDDLTSQLRAVVDRGPLVMTLDENGVPDGFMA